MTLPRMTWLVAASALMLSACATQMPTRPTVAVMPGPYKPFEVFRADDYVCRRFASQQVGEQTPGGAVAEGTATGAAVGTVLGAATGALIGRSGGAAAVGAGTGMLFGAAAGSSGGSQAAWELQRQYNVAYEQCMYSRGNQIPGYATPAEVPPPPPSKPR